MFDIVDGKDFLSSGNELYEKIMENNHCDRIVLNMEGITMLPSVFLNVSLGRYIEEFGLDKARKITFSNITKQQAERIKDYIRKL
jgi:hypothetical protein